MSSTHFLIAGLTIGLLTGCTVFYLVLYRRLRQKDIESAARLTQLKSECEELSNKIFHQERQQQLVQQTAARGKAQLEAELRQVQADKANLEDQYTEHSVRWQQQWETELRQREQLQSQVAQMMKEKAALENSIIRTTAEWQREREELQLENERFRAQVEQLTGDKAAVETRLEGLREAGEQERLGFDIQLAQAQSDMRKLEIKLKSITESNSNSWDQKNSYFIDQVRQLQAEKGALEQKLTAQSAQTQALEEEIGELMEKLLRFQKDYPEEGTLRRY